MKTVDDVAFGKIPSALSTVAAGRDFLTTTEAAHALNRQDQTLRKWACLGNGPISPVRVNGRLMWSVSDIAKLLKGAL